MRWLVAVVGTLCAMSPLARGQIGLPSAIRCYATTKRKQQSCRKIPSTNESTAAEKIHRYEVWPGLRYSPLFIQLAAEKPDDEVAYRCCQWVIRGGATRTGGSSRPSKRLGNPRGLSHAPAGASLDVPRGGRSSRTGTGTVSARFAKTRRLTRASNGAMPIAALAELLAQNYEWIELAQPYATR